MSGSLGFLALIASSAVVAWGQAAALRGYAFRETDGSAPRRQLTLELVQQGKARYRQKTRPDGAFEFARVAAGQYAVRARFNDFVVTEEMVVVSAERANFATVMLPKRRAGVSTFGTITADQLASRSDSRNQKKLQEAARLARGGDSSSAARLYEEVLAAHPSAEVLDALALLYWQQGREEDAYQAFERAIARDPKFLFSYLHLASMYLHRERYKEMAAVAARALDLDPKWFSGHILMAEAQYGLRNWEAAERHARRAAELTKGKAPAPYQLLARIQWARQDCSSARENLKRFLELLTSARETVELRKSIEMIEGCR